tara:strand:- start:146 stop:667 length:522 start_codon:yes stop_codon:yes gene_type:complete
VSLKVIRWRVVGTLPSEHKYVIIVAPHTSNWDFPLFIFVVSMLKLQPSVLIKHTVFRGPLNWFFRYCGGIPVNRKRGGSLVDKIKKIYEEREKFSLIITPEGTRSANPNWKLGFHHIARAANVPILMVYVDSTSRTVGIEGLFEPTADMHADIKQIKKFYDSKKGLIPSNYAS